MKTKLLSILGIVALLLGMFPATVFAAPKPPDYSPIDVGPRLREQAFSPDLVDTPDPVDLAGEMAAAQAAVNASSTDCITATKTFLILNDYTGRYQTAAFNLMGDGALSQVWVQVNLGWRTGDTRATPVVTCEQVSYLQGQFESKIYPTEIDFFGTPDAHTGANAILNGMLGLPEDYYYDAAGRQIVLVSNVRDDNYYDPNYPSYIAGFYSSTFEAYFDRNIMSIDAYDWEHRTGNVPNYTTRPYLYEGVFAHEYQHLLHDDYDSDEETWINEGMAELAEEICGYFPALKGHLDNAALRPENSLTVWEDQGGLEILTDYGQAYLFQHYLKEKFGLPFIQALFHNQDNSITSVNETLAALGINTTFAQIFHDWSVAMLIDSATPAGGRYQFKDFDFKLNVGTPLAPNPDAFDTPGAAPWGTDYIWITGNPKNLARLSFNGLDLSIFPSAWTSDGSALWAGDGNLIDNWAIFPATGGGTLTFDTKYDIEALWDFGFVQVSTDGGKTWASLANDYTVNENDPNAHPKVIANLPGLTGTTDGKWVPMSFDLSAYAGQDILIGLRYVTDWGTTEAGWFVDNVKVDGALVSDGSSMAAFHDLTYYLPIENDFSVTFVGISNKTKGNPYKVLSMKLSDMKEDGLFELNSVLKDSTNVVMLVTQEAAEDWTQYVDYDYSFTYFNSGPKK